MARLWRLAGVRCRNLEVAHANHSPRIRCFHAQQAAEKANKAVLVASDIDFPWTHDLSVLTKLLPGDGEPFAVEPALGLTGYAVDARYPQAGRSITQQEVAEAVDLAQAVVDWAALILD